ncbi:hypothetical protein PSI23_17605 [Xenorhabdus sp. XENO-10]|uniref:Uncharacterized protein n=1 Tax=Xenorhabdus yunnanensis TaxID=3025878 RepID=A0ABT5LIX4_9GAMM|nr:hypothetical protein [Xenorhabdus yunnanensis]MDC9591052.1 hypothetical protein [Xenorhabdus yunnanensis]
MKFEELTDASRQAALEVLADLLRIKYQQTLDLPDSTVRFLGHRVREAFVALESEEPSVVSDSDCAGTD